MLGVLVFIITLVVGTLVGIPVATRLARVHVWKRTALAEMPGERDVYTRVRFEPVDFGEDNMRWPSEVAREEHGIPQRPWPSEGWDDPHFGKGAKQSRDRAAGIAAEREKDRVERVEQRAAETANRNSAAQRSASEQPSRSPQERVQQSRSRNNSGKRRPRPAPRVQNEQPAPVEDEWFDDAPKAKPAPKPKRPAPQPAARKAPPARQQPQPKKSGGDGLPDRAAVEQMVAEMGLAGAVQQLMRTQGWDFKTAAAWLGRVRRG